MSKLENAITIKKTIIMMDSINNLGNKEIISIFKF